MSTIITKFSDYDVNTIDYFIDRIEEEISYRDLKGLTNNKIELINVTKEHPLAVLMASQLSEQRNADPLRSNIIPAISVTPGSSLVDGFTLGQSYQPEVVDDTFINELKFYLGDEITRKRIKQDLLITKEQIETILAEYKRVSAGQMRVQRNEWQRKEEVNVSVWSDSADMDILLGMVTDSVLAKIQVGTTGDNSKIRNMEYRITKGLTNFNFGRVLYGSEYNLTFTNKYNNFEIYTDDNIDGHDFIGTFEIPGE